MICRIKKLNFQEIEKLIKDFKLIIFIDYFQKINVRKTKRRIKRRLKKLCKEAFLVAGKKYESKVILNKCNLMIKEISSLLKKDLEFYLESDPAIYDEKEVILTYPGFYAIFVYRLAHYLYKLNVPYVPRLMTEFAHSKTGIDIHPGAKIDCYFFIDHGTGIVIGETTDIGNHVKIYQGVTLGAISLNKGSILKGKKRHPTIKNYVTIYANASILGGETIIGDNVIIAANTLVFKSIEPYSLVKDLTFLKINKN